MAFMPVYIEKYGDLVGCHHSGTTNEQSNKERQSYSAKGPWKAEMSNIIFTLTIAVRQQFVASVLVFFSFKLADPSKCLGQRGDCIPSRNLALFWRFSEDNFASFGVSLFIFSRKNNTFWLKLQINNSSLQTNLLRRSDRKRREKIDAISKITNLRRSFEGGKF